VRATAREEALVADDGSSAGDAMERLHRWQLSGGTWQVVAESAAGLTISLRTCSTDEEMDRFTSSDPDLAAYVDAQRAEPGDAGG
jgi:hypothetical protein